MLIVSRSGHFIYIERMDNNFIYGFTEPNSFGTPVRRRIPISLIPIYLITDYKENITYEGRTIL